MLDMMSIASSYNLSFSEKISRSQKPRLLRSPIARLFRGSRSRSKIKMKQLNGCWKLSESLEKQLRSLKKKVLRSLKRLKKS